MQTPFRMVCGNFILPEICKPCLFVNLRNLSYLILSKILIKRGINEIKDKKTLGGVLLVAVSAASFGLMPVFTKIAYSAGTSTYSLLFLRFLVAAIFMFLLLLIKKLKLPSLREMLIYFLLGAIGYVGQSFCYFTALNYASSSVVSLLLYTYPALVMVGSAIFLREKVTMQKVTSLCLALCGAFVIIGAEFNANPTGIILSVLSAVFYSAYILISSKVVKSGTGIQSSAFIMLGSTVVYGIINLFLGYTPPAQCSCTVRKQATENKR